MKLFMTNLAIFGISLLSLGSAHAGVGSSGGGIGVQCGKSVQILDLYEARNLQHLKIETPSKKLNGNYLYFSKKFIKYYSNGPTLSNAKILAEIKKSVIDIFSDVKPGSLELSLDATLPKIPSTCRFVQIALYDDTQKLIKLDRSLWRKLSLEDRAALVLHETIYKMARDNRAKTSDETRKVIGLVFSNRRMERMWGEAKAELSCNAGFGNGQNGQWSFSVDFSEELENGVAGLKGYFSLINGFLLLSRASVFLPGQTIESVIHTGFAPIQTQIDQPLVNKTWNVEIIPHPSENSTEQFTRMDIRAGQETLESIPFSMGFCERR